MPIPEPSAAEDPIIRLYDYYYTAADVVYAELKKLWIEYECKHRLSPLKTIKFQRLMQIWLGMLYVTLEGFGSAKIRAYFSNLNTEDIDLRMRWSTVQHRMGQLGPELKAYRNVTFHFQESMTRLKQRG